MLEIPRRLRTIALQLTIGLTKCKSTRQPMRFQTGNPFSRGSFTIPMDCLLRAVPRAYRDYEWDSPLGRTF